MITTTKRNKSCWTITFKVPEINFVNMTSLTDYNTFYFTFKNIVWDQTSNYMEIILHFIRTEFRVIPNVVEIIMVPQRSIQITTVCVVHVFCS